MKKIIFYSWQSDLPSLTNRNFIQKALENAVKKISDDDKVTVEPVVDRDTQGVPGAVDIASTIFAKIATADVFVADVSLINSSEKGRLTPNPNVLIELGYALRELKQERIILIFNSAFGNIENLPFDLRARRNISYKAFPGGNYTSEKKRLEKLLEDAVRVSLENLPITKEESSAIPAVTAIENNQSNKVIVVRRKLKDIFDKLNSIQPKEYSKGGTMEDLIEAVNRAQEPVIEFSKITEAISIMDDHICTLEIYEWFGNIFEKYNLPKGYNGICNNADHDYFRFIGHELFVTLFAFLLCERRWDKIKMLLDRAIPVKYLRYNDGPGNVSYKYASQSVLSLFNESEKRGKISLHADILYNRHHEGILGEILSDDKFIAADFFLFLFSELSLRKDHDRLLKWWPRSVVYMNQVPMFIIDAEYLPVAEQIAQVFGIDGDINGFKRGLNEVAPKLIKDSFDDDPWDFPIKREVVQRIGSRQ